MNQEISIETPAKIDRSPEEWEEFQKEGMNKIHEINCTGRGTIPSQTTLDLLGFNLVSGIDVHGATKMSVLVGGETVSANPYIVVSNTSTNVILIVQEDKSLLFFTLNFLFRE